MEMIITTLHQIVLEIMNKISRFISLLSCGYKIKKCKANNDKIITNH